MLQQTVRRLCDSAGIRATFTNHSLLATSAMHLFEAKVDEQLSMQRTGHLSNAVRSYKRAGEKLRTVTSDVLNGTVITTKHEDVKDEDMSTTEDKDVKAPMVQKTHQNDMENKREQQENTLDIKTHGSMLCPRNGHTQHCEQVDRKNKVIISLVST